MQIIWGIAMQSFETAREWLMKSAEQGNENAMAVR